MLIDKNRRARTVALQILFSQDLNPDAGVPDDMIQERVRKDPEQVRYAHQLIDGVTLQKKEIDAQIEAVLENWKFSRLAETDKNILRIGVFELMNSKEPVAILINEELLNLMAYKVDSFGETPTKPLPPTRLDTLITKWQEIFPDNKVLHRQGKLIFTRRDDKDEYSTTRLSMGEKAVLYYIGATILAPKNAVIFVDNPAEFLHPSIQHIVWDTVEELRRDCSFIYTTHDLDFASTRSENTTIWVRSYDPATTTWDYCVLPPHSTLSDDIYISILGERKPVLFIEGDETHSIDAKLYPLIFRRFAVKPLGSCDKVIEAVRSFNDLKAFHNTDSYGIVDRDRRNDEEVESLRRRKIFVPDVAEIENMEKGGPIAMADCFLMNDGTMEELTAKVNALIDEFLKVSTHLSRLNGITHLLGFTVWHQVRIVLSCELNTSITVFINTKSHLIDTTVICL